MYAGGPSNALRWRKPMRRRNLLLAACITAGCADSSTIPASRPGPVPEHARKQTAASDVGTAQRWRSFWASLSPQERAAGSRAIAAVYAEGGERYAPARIAVVPGSLPEGVVALVTTNPLDPSAPVIVLAEQCADYRSLALANRVAAHPPTLSRAEILEVRIDGTTARAAAIPLLRGARPPCPMVRDLDRGALRTVPIDLPGIGRARLLEFY